MQFTASMSTAIKDEKMERNFEKLRKTSLEKWKNEILPRDPATALLRSDASEKPPGFKGRSDGNVQSTDEPETSKRHQKRLEVRQRPEVFGTQIGALQNCDMPLLQPYLKCVKKSQCLEANIGEKKCESFNIYNECQVLQIFTFHGFQASSMTSHPAGSCGSASEGL